MEPFSIISTVKTVWSEIGTRTKTRTEKQQQQYLRLLVFKRSIVSYIKFLMGFHFIESVIHFHIKKELYIIMIISSSSSCLYVYIVVYRLYLKSLNLFCTLANPLSSICFPYNFSIVTGFSNNVDSRGCMSLTF